MKPKNTPRIHESANHQGGQRLKTLLPSLALLLALAAIAAYPLLHPQEQEITPPSQSIDESSVPPASQRAAAAEPLTAPIPPSDDKNEPRNTLDQYPKAESTWGDTLNPGGTVPAQGYAAYYINQKNPRQTIAQENVTSIAMNYAWDEFHGIPSEQFGAYWVGRLHVPQKAQYSVSGDLSWAKMRVLLNKHILIEGDRGTSLELDAGDYLLEVEYLNNWHTVGFQFAITPAVTELYEDALPAIIAAQKLPAIPSPTPSACTKAPVATTTSCCKRQRATRLTSCYWVATTRCNGESAAARRHSSSTTAPGTAAAYATMTATSRYSPGKATLITTSANKKPENAAATAVTSTAKATATPWGNLPNASAR